MYIHVEASDLEEISVTYLLNEGKWIYRLQTVSLRDHESKFFFNLTVTFSLFQHFLFLYCCLFDRMLA